MLYTTSLTYWLFARHCWCENCLEQWYVCFVVITSSTWSLWYCSTRERRMLQITGIGFPSLSRMRMNWERCRSLLVNFVLTPSTWSGYLQKTPPGVVCPVLLSPDEWKVRLLLTISGSLVEINSWWYHFIKCFLNTKMVVMYEVCVLLILSRIRFLTKNAIHSRKMKGVKD